MIQINQNQSSQNNQGQQRPISQIRPVKRRSRRFFLTSFLFAIFIIFLTWFILSCISSRLAWKAVFLDSNQVYFGRFLDIPFASKITLHDVHYLKPLIDDVNSTTTAAEGDLTVLSIVGDVHGPKDKMTINKDHILYYQELRTDSTLYLGLNQGTAK